MWISRKYEATVRMLAEQFPAVVVTGPRQVGKTALVQRIFPDHTYVTLDVPAIASQAENHPQAFLKSHPQPLIIDEVQYAPVIFRYLKVLIDQDKTPGNFILTGSPSFELMQGISESMAGRCGILNMQNLSFRELQESVGSSEDNYLITGGFPELYTNPEIDFHFWYAAYMSTYLERDVRNILNVGSLRDFDRFLRAVAIRTSQLLSYSDIARDVGISPNTVKKWISVLQASGQIILLESYYRNLGKRLVKSPKLYLCDTGLALFLMGFENIQSVINHPIIGAIWETHVVMQIHKHFHSIGKNRPLWFWRTVHGAETDLLIEQGGQFIAIEIKFSENPNGKALKGINALVDMYGKESLITGFVASRTKHAYHLSESIQVVPGSDIDLYL
jgi:predicted AAA+ superfamily ATPase